MSNDMHEQPEGMLETLTQKYVSSIGVRRDVLESIPQDPSIFQLQSEGIVEVSFGNEKEMIPWNYDPTSDEFALKNLQIRIESQTQSKCGFIDLHKEETWEGFTIESYDAIFIRGRTCVMVIHNSPQGVFIEPHFVPYGQITKAGLVKKMKDKATSDITPENEYVTSLENQLQDLISNVQSDLDQFTSLLARFNSPEIPMLITNPSDGMRNYLLKAHEYGTVQIKAVNYALGTTIYGTTNLFVTFKLDLSVVLILLESIKSRYQSEAFRIDLGLQK